MVEKIIQEVRRSFSSHYLGQWWKQGRQRKAIPAIKNQPYSRLPVTNQGEEPQSCVWNALIIENSDAEEKTALWTAEAGTIKYFWIKFRQQIGFNEFWKRNWKSK